MINNVHQHPEGMIYVRTSGGIYMDSVENINYDFGIEFPPLPEGALERIYDQGKRHAIHGEDGVMGGGDMPWALGDELIARVAEGLLAQAKREDVIKEAKALAAQKVLAEQADRLIQAGLEGAK